MTQHRKISRYALPLAVMTAACLLAGRPAGAQDVAHPDLSPVAGTPLVAETGQMLAPDVMSGDLIPVDGTPTVWDSSGWAGGPPEYQLAPEFAALGHEDWTADAAMDYGGTAVANYGDALPETGYAMTPEELAAADEMAAREWTVSAERGMLNEADMGDRPEDPYWDMQ